MRILVCIDDTDNLDSCGTGELASLMAESLESRGWGKAGYVTRHQLLVHPDIPYTSHNSAMAFSAAIDEERLDDFIAFASDFLTSQSAPESDPGLCVTPWPQARAGDELVRFGRQAKEQVLTKDEAYSLARRWGIHLSEHGGTGQGVIGALAGVGLRLGGNDGRLKGQLRFPGSNGIVRVAQLLAHPWVDVVSTASGQQLEDEEQVQLVDKVKTALIGGRSVLMVEPTPEGELCPWQNLTRRQMKIY